MGDETSPGPLDPRIRAIIGRRLADLRRLMGLTGNQLASRVGTSQSRISRIEHGQAPVTLHELEALTAALDLPPHEAQRILMPAIGKLDPLLDERPTADDIAERQSEIMRIEQTTRIMRVFTPSAVVGLLQTSEYARAALTRLHELLTTDGARPDDEMVLRSVATRLDRQRALADPGRRFHFVMKEAALRSWIGTPVQMLAQIQRIREVLKLNDNVTVTIAPEDSYWSLVAPNFIVYDDTHVLIDLPHSSVVLTAPTDVAIYRRLFDRLEESSATDIDQILDRYLDLYYELARPGRDS